MRTICRFTFRNCIVKPGVIAVLLLLVPGIYSQNISLGVHTGLNFAGASITPAQTTGSRTGIIIGGLIDIAVSNDLSLAPGLQFISKGASSTESGATSTTSLNCLEIPVLAMYKFKAGEFIPHIFAGPNFAFILSANSEVSGGGSSSSSDVSSSFSTFDMGVMFGTGSEFKLSSATGIYLDMAYSFGLSNISKENSVSIKNNGLRVTAGMKFRF